MEHSIATSNTCPLHDYSTFDDNGVVYGVGFTNNVIYRSRSINAYNIGSCRSMGLATWTLDFVDIFTLDNSILTAYNFSTIIFS